MASLFYFFFFGALGSLAPFLALFYRERGVTSQQVGMLLSLQPLIGLVAVPLWNGAADATRRHAGLLRVAVLGTMLSVLALANTSSFIWFIPVVAAMALFGAPILPLVDSAVLDMLGERRKDYGPIRVGGTVGWAMATLAGGVLADRLGLLYGFYTYVVLMAGVVWTTSRLPIGGGALAQPFWVGLRQLVVGWPWALLMLTVLVLHIGLTPINSFLFLHLEDMGGSRSLMGVAWTVATLSELPVFLWGQRLIDRWGPRRLLALALLAYTVRLLGYSVMSVPWMALPIQLLHGVSFGVMWLSAVAYARSLAPQGMGATAQGTLVAVMNLGVAIGSYSSGQLYGTIGAPSLFRWAALLMVVGLVVFSLASRRESRREAHAAQLAQSST